MDEFLEKTIIEQMFQSRREEYEHSFFGNDESTRNLDKNIVCKENAMDEFVKLYLKDDDANKKYFELLQEYKLAYSDKEHYWSQQYYKQGMIDFYKLMNELKNISPAGKTKNINKFYDYAKDELISYIYSDKEFTCEEMQKFKAQYKKIGDKYPKVLEVYEDGNPIELSKEEMKQLVKLHDIDIEMGSLEMRIAFKKGIKEMIN